MDEIQPIPSAVSAEQIADLASDLSDLGLSKDLIALMERGIHSAKLPRSLRSQRSAEAFQSAFEAIGGVPRLVLWADRNPDIFFPLLARMIPTTMAPVLQAMPQTAQTKQDWPEWLTARRLAYQESAEVAEDVTIKGEE